MASVVERAGAILVDGTAGGGGHLVAMAKRLGPGGRAIGLDRDPSMLAEAVLAVGVAGLSDRVTLVHAAYAEMPEVLDQNGIEGVDAIILDLGLSSDQLAGGPRVQFRVGRSARHAIRPGEAVPNCGRSGQSASGGGAGKSVL